MAGPAREVSESGGGQPKEESRWEASDGEEEEEWVKGGPSVKDLTICITPICCFGEKPWRYGVGWGFSNLIHTASLYNLLAKKGCQSP